jgi:hypothetical protein
VQDETVPKEEKRLNKSVTAKDLQLKYKAQANIADWTIEIYEIFKQPGFCDKKPEEKPNAPNAQNKSASDYWKCIEKKYILVGDEFHNEIHDYLQELWDKFKYDTLKLNFEHNGGW